jgi:transposase
LASLPVGAITGQRRAGKSLDQLPMALQAVVASLLQEVRTLEGYCDAIERELARVATTNPDIEQLRQVPGIGLLTATALWAAVGSPLIFRSGRHLSAWLGLTPREFSSGSRELGRISKRGDVYLRMLLTHGARAVLARAKQLSESGKTLNRLQRWALDLDARRGHNTATCALANKLARIAWATWRHAREFNGDFVSSPVALH